MTTSLSRHRGGRARTTSPAGPALGMVLALVFALSACGADSPSGNDLDRGRTDQAEAEASATLSAGADLGGMNQQAEQLAHSLPAFAPLTEALSGSATPAPRASATPSQGAGATGRLDACSVVTNEVLVRDLGLEIPEPPTTQASGFDDPDATDCVYASANGIVVVRATTRAETDLPASDVDAVLAQAGSAAIPTADRGYAYVPDESATSGAAVVTVVVGQRGLSVVLTAGQPITLAEAEQLGAELVTGLQ